MLEKSYQRLANNNGIAHLLSYIKENIRETFNLEQISEKACMSKAHFCRMVKQELGITPMVYILQERLTLAKKHLQMGKYQIQEVCYLSGFNNPT